MSCQSCVAARDAEISALADSVKEAQLRADTTGNPVFVLRTEDGYVISDEQQPNTIDVRLPTPNK